MKKLLFALLLIYPVSALAATYEWTDQHGTVHFTEDLGKVPKKYRKKAKVLGADEGGVTQTTTMEPAKGEGKAKAKEPEKGAKLYGGRDEGAWRTSFKSAQFEVQRLETELSTLQGRMNDTSKMSRSEYIAVQNTIKHTEVRLSEARSRLDRLNQEANRAGVPMEFRQ